MYKFVVKQVVTGLAGLSIMSSLYAQERRDYPIQPVLFTQVRITDQFWAPKLRVHADITIPYTLGRCERMGRVDNFLRAAHTLPADTMTAFPFDDTDLYKAIEGASYSLQTKRNPDLEKKLDTLIADIRAAQEPDGYLYTFRTMQARKPHEWIGVTRWEKEEDLSHELYNAGHLYEAAVAHYQATGKKTLLQVAIKNADLLVKTFGPGKVEKFPGHQIVETGLTRLYRVTGKKEYLSLAKYLLDLRGTPGHFNQEYSQSNIKVTDQHTAVGHAVRAAYMYTGMADVAALTGNQQYLQAIDDIWHDVVDKKLYITGGIGATNNGEAFGDAYDLPNMSAYAETCAAIANLYWNHRMFLLHGDARYIDVLERILYNGLLSGVSLSGNRFFYPNPLASLGQHQRSAWFDCACCISSMTRFLPSMPGYIYAQNGNNLYLNLFVGSDARIRLPAATVQVVQATDYPWKGGNVITINPDKPVAFALHIRIPGWAIGEPIPDGLYRSMNNERPSFTILLNGQKIHYTTEKGYAVINRTWKKGDQLTLDLPMNVQKIAAMDSVKQDAGRFALQRGPVVYCLEGPDNKDSAVMNIVVDTTAAINAVYRTDLLNGVMTLTMPGNSTAKQLNTEALLKAQQSVTAIPYYAWNNRGAGEMEVWIPFDATKAKAKPAPTIASTSKVTGTVNPRMFRALNDQYDPADSKDASASYLHWWPKRSSTEWVQYTFDSTHTISQSQVYWFDDGPWGGCRIPAGWKLFYKKGEEWVPVHNTTPYEIAKDKYNTVTFDPVTTTALKLEVQLPADNSAGIHEWRVR